MNCSGDGGSDDDNDHDDNDDLLHNRGRKKTWIFPFLFRNATIKKPSH